MADVCAGLHAAHELLDAEGKPLNVVHRDVSPQNILMSSGGVVKVIDFGVVKARQRKTEETAIGIIKGKLWYMAPEQALGHPVDRRADIWAVGAILYRLLARRPVFQESSPLATFKRLTSAGRPDPLPASVPEALAGIVRKALEFEPRRRYASAAELGAALEGLLRGPNQTTAKDVAATLERYLGRSLALRRHAISDALATLGQGPPLAVLERGGASQVKTIVDVPRRLSSEPPISLSIPSLPVASRSTAPLQTLPSGRARWLASAAVVTLGLGLGGLFGARQLEPVGGRLKPAQALAPVPRATTLVEAPHPVEPSAQPNAVLAPLVPPPVSLQALPVLREATSSAVQAKRALRRKRSPKAPSITETDSSAGAVEPAPSRADPSATAALRPAPSGDAPAQ
jgi:serine/threonine-protein kinase